MAFTVAGLGAICGFENERSSTQEQFKRFQEPSTETHHCLVVVPRGFLPRLEDQLIDLSEVWFL